MTRPLGRPPRPATTAGPEQRPCTAPGDEPHSLAHRRDPYAKGSSPPRGPPSSERCPPPRDGWQHGHVCTVVTRFDGGAEVRILALRDELAIRAFDDPGRWWPDQPTVIGGRDRLAGGTWCASRVDTGESALVLNRPERRLADPGTPSRGILPLVAVEHGPRWPQHVRVDGMASFSLVLAGPGRLVSWLYDGESLSMADHAPGTCVFTSGHAEDGKAERYRPRFETSSFPDAWREVVQSEEPADDPAALVVHRARGGRVFATVFGQLIDARPGTLLVEHSRQPWSARAWRSLEVACP